MRIKLTLDNDLAEKVKELARHSRSSYKQVVNDTLRAGLRARSKPQRPARKFQVKPSHCGFRPGVDIAKLNRMLDHRSRF